MRPILATCLILMACSAKRADPDEAQMPFDFRIVKPPGSDPAYMDWTHGGLTEIHGRVPGEFDFLWFHPPCTSDCEDIPEGECGCLECEPPVPVMREFEPFGEVLLHWEGRYVWTLEEDSCGCPCARARELPVPSEIIVGLVSWQGYACIDVCATVDGLIENAGPDGERLCATRYMDIPHEEDEWTILMGTVCDSDWP